MACRLVPFNFQDLHQRDGERRAQVTSRFLNHSYPRAKTQRRSEQKLVDFKGRISGYHASFFDFTRLGVKIDGPIFVKCWRRQAILTHVIVNFEGVLLYSKCQASSAMRVGVIVRYCP